MHNCISSAMNPLETSRVHVFRYRDNNHLFYFYEEGTTNLIADAEGSTVGFADFVRTQAKVVFFDRRGVLSRSALASFLSQTPKFSERESWRCDQPDGDVAFGEAMAERNLWMCRDQDKFLPWEPLVPFFDEQLPVDQNPRYQSVPRLRK